jgi:hypothetical protein
MRPFRAGAIAGLTATAPMTAVMLSLHEALPRQRRYPLPHREIVKSAFGSRPRKKQQDPSEHTGGVYLAHFAYGTLMAALFGPLNRRLPGHPAMKGSLFGLLVWAMSYLAWLAASGILPPPNRRPAEWNIYIVLAHLVWGASLGLITRRLMDRRIP